jgi:hypothetical protein
MCAGNPKKKKKKKKEEEETKKREENIKHLAFIECSIKLKEKG